MSESKDHDLFAPLSVVERHHTENKAFRSEHYNVHEKLTERLATIEHTVDSAKERLDEHLRADATAFKQIEDQIERLNAKITWPIWKVIVTIVSAISMAGALIWAAARYPDRAEFDRLNQQFQEMRVEQAILNRSLETVTEKQAESQTVIKATLDKLNDKIDDLDRFPDSPPMP